MRKQTSECQEWAKASIGIVAGVLLTLAVELWLLMDFGFIRRRDPQTAANAERDMAYSMIAVNGLEE